MLDMPLASSTKYNQHHILTISKENPNLDSGFDNTKYLNLVFWYELRKGN